LFGERGYIETTIRALASGEGRNLYGHRDSALFKALKALETWENKSKEVFGREVISNNRGRSHKTTKKKREKEIFHLLLIMKAKLRAAASRMSIRGGGKQGQLPVQIPGIEGKMSTLPTKQANLLDRKQCLKTTKRDCGSKKKSQMKVERGVRGTKRVPQREEISDYQSSQRTSYTTQES